MPFGQITASLPVLQHIPCTIVEGGLCNSDTDSALKWNLSTAETVGEIWGGVGALNTLVFPEILNSSSTSSLTPQQWIRFFVPLPCVPSGFLSTAFEFSGGHSEQADKIFLLKFLCPFVKSFSCLEKVEKHLHGKEKHSLVGLWNSCSSSNVLRIHLQFVVLVLSKCLGSSYASDLSWVRLHLTQFLVNSWVL